MNDANRLLRILYRGPLSSCNYGCPYCPFAKHHETAAELQVDRACLQRFADWIVQNSQRRYGILFTPWGEALTRRWYRETMVRFSHQDHVDRVAVQTNLSTPLDWVQNADLDSIAFWCTYHPGEVSREDFLAQCQHLDAIGARYSVGVVGLNEHHSEIVALRERLRPEVYLWINAYKRQSDYYDDQMLHQLTMVDPHFPTNNTYHSSLGQHCHTGESVISVDGEGQIRRCHFIKEVIGNLYEDDLRDVLKPRRCTNGSCGCHIGYVHLPKLDQEAVYGDGILELSLIHISEPTRPY